MSYRGVYTSPSPPLHQSNSIDSGLEADESAGAKAVHPVAITTSIETGKQEKTKMADEKKKKAKKTDKMEKEIDKLSLSDDSVHSLCQSKVRLTEPAPYWEGTAVFNGRFKDIKLTDYKDKYLVFFFYPLDFTFVCPTEIIAFSDKAEEFRKIGCEVVACSADSHFSHLAWVNTPRKDGGLGKMNIPLVADKNLHISRDYGVLKNDEGVAFRGLFIIDDKQRVRQMTLNDLPVGRSVDETFRLVQAFQYTDKFGEVCPAGWQPGEATMKPDPDASKEYFEKVN